MNVNPLHRGGFPDASGTYLPSMVRVCTQPKAGTAWIDRARGRRPGYACVLGFTETTLIPGISAAGATPEARRYTAIADAEFLHHGLQAKPAHPLPPLTAGVSPAVITRAVLARERFPLWLIDAGLPQAPTVPCIHLNSQPARCLSTGQAMPLAQVQHLFQQGLAWGEHLARQVADSYLILAECVTGGTSTALAVLLGLGYDAANKVNSSHLHCNHEQKLALAQQGLALAGLLNQGSLEAHLRSGSSRLRSTRLPDRPLQIVAAVGDPMQPVVAGMTLAASRRVGVLLAGGTQMLAIYALAQAIAQAQAIPWNPTQVAIGTTHWVVEDLTSDTIGLARLIGSVPLLASQFRFTQSRHAALQAYEQGFVKEGVGAGGCAIAAHLYRRWSQPQFLNAVESLLDQALQTHHSDTQPKP